ncbi:carboxynorspermidine decarboxylase [Leptotrichia sp. oral taxon 221]|uniref:carboxynorspermidine decarboxylase n=1 Tax=Leptotrichia sp. oral taxon 221 TaxID=712362 RepID=UPI001B8C88F7|nr:carboxynorspermidine decarboxylase [Leptotrichia sp. oral taxon 221]QUB96722.1 carboxynorspermidine decarboxylase [Leptotrichia sp. oral taxon 221]
MAKNKYIDIDITNLPTPSFLVDERLLKRNLKILKDVKDRTGCKILLAQKGFSMFYFYPLIGHYLDGTTASSLFEAKLGYEEMEKKFTKKKLETHIFNPSYRDDEFDEILDITNHIVFNSFAQWNKFKGRVQEKIKATGKHISCGLRVNPEFSEVETEIYNPAGRYSRFGVTIENFKEDELEGLEGLHFHTLCEQNSDALENVLKVFEEKFGKYLHGMKWVNFGGGHHVTRKDYDVEKLIKCINHIKETYNVQVYLEPGEAVALNTGFLVSEVLDITKNEMDILLLDTSASCHMPDVIEMPYRPFIFGSGLPNEKKYTYRLGGPTCLAGDIVGDYSFDEPVKVGDKLIFTDMAHYSMVKTNTFNGINLPSIAVYTEKDGLKVIRTFKYEDFKNRLS